MQDALINLERLLADAEIHHAAITLIPHREEELQRFRVELAGRRCDLWMPDIPLEQIRYLRGDRVPTPHDGGILPPRVTINGSAWSWPAAVDAITWTIGGRDVPDDRKGLPALTAEAVAERRRREQAWRDVLAVLKQ